MGSANSYSAKDELLKVARVICDAFDYNPGHSDLDANQPIWIGVTLGDWRKLHFALATIKSESESSGPNCLPAEPTYEMLKALAGDPVILAASHEEEYRKRYEAMLLAAYPATLDEGEKHGT